MVHPFVLLALVGMFSAAEVVAGASQAKPKAPRKAAKKPAAAAPTPAPPPPVTDLRMKTAYTLRAQVSQNTTYLQGPRQRVEFPGVVLLDQCDLKRSVMLNTAAKRYRAQPYAVPAVTPAPTPAPLDPQAAQLALMMGGPQASRPRGGVVELTTTLTDTLERQSMLGLEARRIKSVLIKRSSETACDKSPLKVEIDAWYVDLPPQSDCPRATATAPAAPSSDPDACVDRIDTRVVGDVKLGFPIKTVTTTMTGEGDKVEESTAMQEVTELEITRLDPALFEVPADFAEASSSAEIVPALASGGSLAETLFGSTADGSSVGAPKRSGMIRIGILEPINKTTRDLPPRGLRRDLVAKFNKTPYEAIPVAGNSASAVEGEASRLQCDYLMLAEIVEAKTSKPGKLGGVMRLTSGEPPKDAHAVKLEYRLFAVGATQTPRVTGNAKASSGGFGVGSALQIAAFAGRVYMGMMMGGMGAGMNPMAAMSGGAGGPGSRGGGFFDPRAMAVNTMVTGLGAGMTPDMGDIGAAGMGDPSEAGMRETVSAALGNGAKSVMEQLDKKR